MAENKKKTQPEKSGVGCFNLSRIIRIVAIAFTFTLYLRLSGQATPNANAVEGVIAFMTTFIGICIVWAIVEGGIYIVQRIVHKMRK